MVLVQNRDKDTLVCVLRTRITCVMHSSPSCYITLCTQVIRLNCGNLGPQKTDSGVFIIIFYVHFYGQINTIYYHYHIWKKNPCLPHSFFKKMAPETND